MDATDRKALHDLLLSLMSAQDDVTHYNEAGDTARCFLAKLTRDDLRRRIEAFVELRFSD